MNFAEYFRRLSVASLLALALPCSHLVAENSVERALKNFTKSDVQGYVQPLQDLFAANMTAGWYRSANVPQSGFHISFNIIGMGAFVGDDMKSYTASAPTGYNPGTFTTATMFGKTRGTVIDANTGLSYSGRADGAFDMSIFPLATLQATIGHLQGTELIIRGIPLPEISNLPKITFWGAGLRHSISQYFGEGEPPVHVAFGVFYNKISFGDFIGATSFIVGPQISKEFSILELYGGFGYTKNTMTLNFTSSASGSPLVDVTLDGADKVRGTVGAVLNLAILHLQADLNFGTATSVSASIGFGF